MLSDEDAPIVNPWSDDDLSDVDVDKSTYAVNDTLGSVS